MGYGVVLNHPRRPNDPDWKILAGFDSSESLLKPEHIEWLRNHAIRRAREGAYCWIRGFASRKGPEAFNQTVSDHRASAVRRFLLGQGVPPRQVTGSAGIGSRWSTGGRHDNSENWRGVEVILSPRPHVETHQQPAPAPTPEWRPGLEWYRFYIRFYTAIINAWVSSGGAGVSGGGISHHNPDGTGSHVGSRATPDYTWFLISAGAQGFDVQQRDQLHDFYCNQMAPVSEADIPRHVEDLKRERNNWVGIVERHEYGPTMDPGWVPPPFRQERRRDDRRRLPGSQRFVE